MNAQDFAVWTHDGTDSILYRFRAEQLAREIGGTVRDASPLEVVMAVRMTALLDEDRRPRRRRSGK